ncbi:ParA family protein [Paenibacillus caui]|uniref:ParA family protein n=1 Tax=Paenibacillus caui TaxID=2873927 RepID=UPI001CA9F4B6|nr:AAA family ATPase [Paenibacillus caui]
MISICFFNNKGGVGKTTLVSNISSFFSNSGLRVLLIDADPQCNATQSILPPEMLEDYENLSFDTLFQVLEPFEEGEVEINTTIKPLGKDSNRFNIDILPGHPRLSLLEDLLSRAWLEIIGTELGGLRKSNWCYQLNKSLEKDYDLIIYDVGPSLGALNRSILIGCNFFVTPMGCDTFSIMGVKNISGWLNDWHKTYETGINAVRQRNEEMLNKFITRGKILESLSEQARFAGYTVQQYITKVSGGERRPTKAFENILQAIPSQVVINLREFIGSELPTDDLISQEIFKLGDIPHLYSLVPLSQSANAPIFKLTSKDGIVGAQYSQIEEYKEMLESISMKLLTNIGFGE